MLADQYGSLVGAANPTGMAVDAFGRARMSQPYTIFDSQHRYQDNGKINQANSASGATVTHNANAGLIECTIDTTANSFVYRESSRVFNYQPGKSLLILQTYVMNPVKTNLRQRYGYFNTENGVYLELDGTSAPSWVKRSKSSGSVTETKIPQSEWNVDKLDGTGPSRLTLDMSKAQIQFTDIEWLGLGTVRVGFVINGQFIHCHSFHHSNIITSTYMTTACLPVRAEIENTGATASNSTLKIVCTSVISEGGFEPRGIPRSVSIPVSTPKDIPTAGTFVPIMSIRLKDTFADAIVYLRSFTFFGVSNNTSYRWKLVKGNTLTGASWVSAGNDSPVEYDITATALTGGVDLKVEYVNVASGSGASVSDIGASEAYRYQLERNSFTASNKGIIFTLAATGAANGNDAVAAIQWEEVVT
jgi:hypothetical protein